MMTGLDYLVGKTITRVDCSAHDEFVLFHFDDGTTWLAVANRFGWGARIEGKMSHGHHLPPGMSPAALADKRKKKEDAAGGG